MVPNMIDPDQEPDQPALIRTGTFLDHPRLDITQGRRLLATYRLRRTIPNRSHHIPSGWQRLVRPGEDVVVSVS
jgi:hypothetical protein